jgi:hypothetical protein
MGQINIVISIKTNELKAALPNGGEIPDPDLFVLIQDDEVFDAEDATHAEITTYVNPGSVMVWTIKSLSTLHEVQFTNIEFPPAVLLEPPVLFYNQRKCIGVVNKTLTSKKGYYVEFYMDGDPRTTWYWDPYVEPHTG